MNEVIEVQKVGFGELKSRGELSRELPHAVQEEKKDWSLGEESNRGTVGIVCRIDACNIVEKISFSRLK